MGLQAGRRGVAGSPPHAVAAPICCGCRCGLDLERSFDGRTVYLNKLEGVKAAEGGGAPAIVARPELVGRVARLEKVLLTSY